MSGAVLAHEMQHESDLCENDRPDHMLTSSLFLERAAAKV